jgi:hypothetical protein
MYAGLLLLALGLSLCSASPARALATAALAWVLDAKAGQEEALLTERYGAAYEAYAQRTPRLLPAVPLLTPAAKKALGALGGWAASVAEEEEGAEGACADKA